MAKRSRKKEKIQKRRKPQRSPYELVLIVCEGSKTEPNYFKSLIDQLKLNTANVEVDPSSDSAPISVVQHAKKRCREDFDRVYCVFDKDEHSTYENAIRGIKDNAKLHKTVSVPCFEYWLLLHFTYTTKPFSRSGNDSPADVVIKELKYHLPNYAKGDREIFSSVLEHTNIAIENAKKANRAARQTDTDNPSTEIHKLVEYLRNLKA